jgi:hypothetical protein
MITISDVDLQKAWLDVYATSGITVGTAVDIQNKGSDMVFVQVKGSTPAADNRDGYVILPYEKLQIGAGGAGLWALGAGELTVTEAVPLAITASASSPVSTVYGIVSKPKKVNGVNSKNRCKGITKSGKRCKHYTRIGNDYCYQHQP